MNGVERIAAERQRQIDEKGYSPEHDEHHKNGALAFAAACYAAPETIYVVEVSEGTHRDGAVYGSLTWNEPWPAGWGRKTDRFSMPSRERRIRDLEKAGALIAAELDRLLALAQEVS